MLGEDVAVAGSKVDGSGRFGCCLGFRSPFYHPFMQILLVTLVLLHRRNPYRLVAEVLLIFQEKSEV